MSSTRLNLSTHICTISLQECIDELVQNDWTRNAYEMFSWFKYLFVSLVFSHLGFWSGSLFLIAPFPDLCLLVLF